MTCRVCGGECPVHVTECDGCTLDLWVEAQRGMRCAELEQIEVFRSILNEPTEAIWSRIEK